MTLLEALLATVILAVVAVACLEGTHGAADLQHRAAAVNAALSRAESALEQAREPFAPPVNGVHAEGGAQVHRMGYTRFPDARVERVSVEVRDADGRLVRLTRLVEQRPGTVR